MKAALLALLTLAPASAGAFDIAFPVDCRLGKDCFIQQYVDRDASHGTQDFTCGPLSYDGHDGTDIAVPTLADMMDGVPVTAADDGQVLRVRTSVPDITVAGAPVQFPEGQDCGNGVVIDHGDGWQTQYCHLRRGSTRLHEGDRVARGQVIGEVGQSGNAEFPHLHFSLRKDGATLDPFAPTLPAGACAPPGGTAALWSEAVAYQAGGIVDIGFADQVPTFDQIKQGLPAANLPADAPAIVLWVHLYGHRAGDRLRMTITGPLGTFSDQTQTLERTQARAFRAIGRKIADRPNWTGGQYRADVVLLRDGAEIDRRRAVIDMP